MIAASSVETKGNNKPIPQVLLKTCLQNISLVSHRHEFQNGKRQNKQENLCKFTIKCETSDSNIYEGRSSGLS